MRVEKPRIFQNGRDIFLSLLVLIAIMIFVVGGTGLCQYHPGDPEPQTSVEINADQALKTQAQALNFPVRNPQLPQDWVANSARRVTYDEKYGVTVGWVIKDQWISITQTAAEPKAIIANFDQYKRELTDKRTIDGQQWDVYTGEVGQEDARPLWIHNNGESRWIVSGLGTEDHFTTAARAMQQAKPISEGTEN